MAHTRRACSATLSRVAAESAIRHPQHAQPQSHHRDELIAELASRQHGVVSRGQLLALGLSRGAIAVRLRSGRLHPLHRGVYAVGHRSITIWGRWMGAVLLAGGRGAVLSHRSAAALWGLRRAGDGPIETAAPRSTRSCAGIRRHYATLDPDDEVTVQRGIPVTTVSRTLLDLAAVAPPEELERALREAEVLRLPQRPPLAELLTRRAGHRGAGVLGKRLERLGRLPGGVTRSRLEDRFLTFVARQGLPMPETNVVLDLQGGRVEADCLWRGARLIVELDGHEAHGTRAAFESDRKRDRDLRVAGWTVVRLTWRQLRDEPRALAGDLRRLLC